MPGDLTHSPADVTRQLLIDLSLGSASGNWSTFVGDEPDRPDRAITVYNTEGQHNGRVMVGGEVQEHHGIQVRVRAETDPVAFTKANAIAQGLSKSVNRTSVTVSSTNYVAWSYSVVNGPIHLGQPTTKRHLYTINLLASIRAA